MFRSLSFRKFITFINTSETGIKQTFGKAGGIFNNNPLLNSGIHFYIPFIQKILTISNKRHEMNHSIRCRSNDGVTVEFNTSIHYTITPEDTYNYVFSIKNPTDQIKSTMADTFRSSIAMLPIDEIFSQQDKISTIVIKNLQLYKKYGFTINNVFINNIIPDNNVNEAMNKVNSSLRELHVSQNLAEASRIKIVKEAEARAESMKLIGKGISDQREKILMGYSDQIKRIQKDLSLSNQDIMKFILNTMSIDRDRELAQSSNSKLIFLNKHENDFTSQTDKSIPPVSPVNINYLLDLEEKTRK